MKVRWKIALLTLLGFSTAACCTTKKAAKDSDGEGQNIETEGIDTRIILMYGVPTPDGRFPAPEDTPEIIRPVTPFPDGRVAVELTEERAAELMEKMKEAEAEAEVTIVEEVNGVPFPDGRVAIVLTEERAAELIRAMEEGERRQAEAEGNSQE